MVILIGHQTSVASVCYLKQTTVHFIFFSHHFEKEKRKKVPFLYVDYSRETTVLFIFLSLHFNLLEFMLFFCYFFPL